MRNATMTMGRDQLWNKATQGQEDKEVENPTEKGASLFGCQHSPRGSVGEGQLIRGEFDPTGFILYEERAWDTSMRSCEVNDLEYLLWCRAADVGAHPNLSAMVKPLNLTGEEKTDLIAFLKRKPSARLVMEWTGKGWAIEPGPLKGPLPRNFTDKRWQTARTDGELF
jgi:hypothetical protein